MIRKKGSGNWKSGFHFRHVFLFGNLKVYQNVSRKSENFGTSSRNWKRSCLSIKNTNFWIHISLQPDVVDLWYFQLWVMSGPRIKFEISKVYTIRLQRCWDQKKRIWDDCTTSFRNTSRESDKFPGKVLETGEIPEYFPIFFMLRLKILFVRTEIDWVLTRGGNWSKLKESKFCNPQIFFEKMCMYYERLIVTIK